MSEPMRVFGWPIAIGVLTFVGLMAALWGGSAWAWLSWIGLGAPLVIIVTRLAKGRGRMR